MARYKKKPTKESQLPSLWDPLSASETDDGDVVLRMIKSHRQRQKTPRHIMSDREIDHHMRTTAVRPDELEFISFGSGSSGNCAYIGVRGKGGVLIDAGIDHKVVADALERNCIMPDTISGIIVTHDHLDHVRYIYQLVRMLDQGHDHSKQIYCTPRTLNGMLRRHNVSSRIKDYHRAIYKEYEYKIGPFKVVPFEVSHDGTDNVGFFITTGGHNFVVATDMGKVTERADYYMRQANYLMIESNYDSQMLDRGKYPEYLKARIRSDRGHHGNAETASYLAEIVTPRLTNIYLCHLSQDNNTPQLAYDCTYQALTARGIAVGDGSGSSIALTAQVQLSWLPRYTSSPLYIHRLKPL